MHLEQTLNPEIFRLAGETWTLLGTRTFGLDSLFIRISSSNFAQFLCTYESKIRLLLEIRRAKKEACFSTHGLCTAEYLHATFSFVYDTLSRTWQLFGIFKMKKEILCNCITMYFTNLCYLFCVFFSAHSIDYSIVFHLSSMRSNDKCD